MSKADAVRPDAVRPESIRPDAVRPKSVKIAQDRDGDSKKLLSPSPGETPEDRN